MRLPLLSRSVGTSGEGPREGRNPFKPMSISTFSKSLNLLLSAFCILAITFLASCGGDDEATPDCSSLELSATVEGNTITASATGGSAPYQFSLNGGTTQSTGSFTDLEPGTYAVEVTDASECTDSQTLTVIDPCANFSISTSASAYEITIALTSGVPPFKYGISYGDKSLEGTSNERSFTVEVEEAAATNITITDASDCVLEDDLTADEVRTFTDTRDGQTYQTIKIGDQIWFAENLNFETESNSYCYDNEAANCETYGRLYTWDIAQTVAPEGWGLPSKADYQTLINATGGGAPSVDALKIEGTSGYNFLMAGKLFGGSDEFDNVESLGYAWTSTENNDSEAVSFGIRVSSNTIGLTDGFMKSDAHSIRIIKE